MEAFLAVPIQPPLVFQLQTIRKDGYLDRFFLCNSDQAPEKPAGTQAVRNDSLAEHSSVFSLTKTAFSALPATDNKEGRYLDWDL